MTPTIASVNPMGEESLTNIVSFSKHWTSVVTIIAKTVDRIRIKIESKHSKNTLLDTSIMASWNSSEDINIKIHKIIDTAIEVLFANPDIGAGNATVKLIKDCLLLTNPDEYTGIKNKLLQLTEYDSLALISDDDLPAILLAFR